MFFNYSYLDTRTNPVDHCDSCKIERTTIDLKKVNGFSIDVSWQTFGYKRAQFNELNPSVPERDLERFLLNFIFFHRPQQPTADKTFLILRNFSSDFYGVFKCRSFYEFLISGQSSMVSVEDEQDGELDQNGSKEKPPRPLKLTVG